MNEQIPQRIELPIQVEEPTPFRPDLKWGIKMILIFVGVVAFTYGFLWLLSLVAIKYMDIPTEKKLFAHSPVEGKKFDYQTYLDFKIPEFEQFDFYLMPTSQINAYASLGAQIYLTSGLFSFLKYQEELAFVMAHEVGHIVSRDVLRSITINLPLEFILANLWFDINISNISLTKSGVKTLSKNAELNADKFAAQLLVKHGLNPLCAKPFFEREHDFKDTLIEMLSDHPTNIKRIDLLKNMAQQYWYRGTGDCHTLVFNP